MCQSTLGGQQLIDISVDSQLIFTDKLWVSIDICETVNSLPTIYQLTSECQFSVNQVSIKMLIEGRLRVSIDTRPQMPLVHMIYKIFQEFKNV